MDETKTPIETGQSAAHTPTPWKNVGFKITDEAGRTIVDLRSVPMLPFASDTEIANAEFIVRAVNSHQDLLEACQFALSELETMKSEDFALGRDQAVRDKLRNAIYLGR